MEPPFPRSPRSLLPLLTRLATPPCNNAHAPSSPHSLTELPTPLSPNLLTEPTLFPKPCLPPGTGPTLAWLGSVPSSPISPAPSFHTEPWWTDSHIMKRAWPVSPLPSLLLQFLSQCQPPGQWGLRALELTALHPSQQASVLSPGRPGSRLHHLPPWCGPLHGFSGEGP